MKREIISWAFGFFTLPILAACVALAIGGIGWWFALPETFKWLKMDAAWAGCWLFIATAILGGIAVWRFI